MAGSALEERIIRAADAALAEQGHVSPLEVLLSLGWLARTTSTCGARAGSTAWRS
jgi:hypothetical protein